MLKDLYLLPKPKYLQIEEKSGIRLNKFLNIFINKHKIYDNSLMISSRFHKHLKVFLELSPIYDRYLKPEIGDTCFFSVITSENNFFNNIADSLNDRVIHLQELQNKYNNYIIDSKKEVYNYPKINNLIAEEGYLIEIKEEAIWIYANSRKGYFYGIQTLIQIIDNVIFTHINPEEFIIIPETLIVDFPSTQFRAFHLDLKELMPTFDYLKEFLYFLSRFKYNTVVIEYEDKFDYQGRLKSVVHELKLTEEQFFELTEICKMIYIDIVPLIQIFGHIERWLRTDTFKHLREDPKITDEWKAQSLCPLHPDSEPFIYEMIDQICKAHPNSKYVHIGADEVYQLGTCEKCKEFIRENSKSKLYIHWINKAASRVISHGKIPIMWSDYLIKYPESMDELDKRVIVMYWDYEAGHKYENYLWIEQMPKYQEILAKTPMKLLELYKDYYWVPDFPNKVKLLPFFEYFKRKGHEVIGAPTSAGHFRFLIEDYYHCINNIYAHALRSMESNSLGVLITSWACVSDPLDTQIPLIALVSNAIWSPENISSEKNEDNSFDIDWDYYSNAIATNIFEVDYSQIDIKLKQLVQALLYPLGENIDRIRNLLNAIDEIIPYYEDLKDRVYEYSTVIDAIVLGLTGRKYQFEIYEIFEILKDLFNKFEDTKDIMLFIENKQITYIKNLISTGSKRVREIEKMAKLTYISNNRIHKGELDFIFNWRKLRFVKLFKEKVPILAEKIPQLIATAELLNNKMKMENQTKLEDMEDYLKFEDLIIDISRIIYFD